MKEDRNTIIERLKKDGMSDKADRFLKKYPDSLRHLTYRELKEQVAYFH